MSKKKNYSFDCKTPNFCLLCSTSTKITTACVYNYKNKSSM